MTDRYLYWGGVIACFYAGFHAFKRAIGGEAYFEIQELSFIWWFGFAGFAWFFFRFLLKALVTHG